MRSAARRRCQPPSRMAFKYASRSCGNLRSSKSSTSSGSGAQCATNSVHERRLPSMPLAIVSGKSPGSVAMCTLAFAPSASSKAHKPRIGGTHVQRRPVTGRDGAHNSATFDQQLAHSPVASFASSCNLKVKRRQAIRAQCPEPSCLLPRQATARRWSCVRPWQPREAQLHLPRLGSRRPHQATTVAGMPPRLQPELQAAIC